MLMLSRSLGNTVHTLNSGSFENVVFCPLSTTSGDSAEGILRNLRMTMTGRNSPRITPSNHVNVITDLSEPEFTDDVNHKKIILIDHFIGSGDTIIQTWGGIQQWQNENHDYYVGVLVAYEDAISNVESTFNNLHILPMITLPASSRAFHESNSIFTANEKKILKNYCSQLNIRPPHQFGYNDGQSLVVFSNRVSNNVLPILYYETENWTPLFPRIQ